MVYREDEQERALREKGRTAIALAMESRWEEAAAVNREILDLSPNDLEACNRLGKALLEMGDTEGARHAFARSLEIAPNNTIAKKNLERLASMPSAPRPLSMGGGSRLAPRLFISDSGKSAQVALMAPAPERQRPFISPGAPVALVRQDGYLAAHTDSGEYLGLVPPKLGQRLICLMEGGNQYDGVVFGSTAETIKVILRETYQHPSQRAKLSFLSSDSRPEPSDSSPEPVAANELAEDADTDYDADAPLRPIELSWVEDDDEEPLGVAGAAVGNVLDGGYMEDPFYNDVEEE